MAVDPSKLARLRGEALCRVVAAEVATGASARERRLTASAAMRLVAQQLRESVGLDTQGKARIDTTEKLALRVQEGGYELVLGAMRTSSMSPDGWMQQLQRAERDAALEGDVAASFAYAALTASFRIATSCDESDPNPIRQAFESTALALEARGL